MQTHALGQLADEVLAQVRGRATGGEEADEDLAALDTALPRALHRLRRHLVQPSRPRLLRLGPDPLRLLHRDERVIDEPGDARRAADDALQRVRGEVVERVDGVLHGRVEAVQHADAEWRWWRDRHVALEQIGG